MNLLKPVTQPALLLLLSVLLVILPHLARMPVSLVLLALLVLGWRLLHDQGRAQLPRFLLRMVLLVLTITALLMHYHTVVGRDAGSALLVMLLCLKLLETRGPRDVAVVVFLGFFVIITNFLFSQSLFIGAYMLLVVISLLATLISVQLQPAPYPSVPGLRRQFRHAGRLLLQAAPLALLMFVLFPRVPGPLWGLPEDAHSARTGLSDEMSPGRISRLVDSNAVAFRVNFNDGIPPPAAQRYWRGPVLWHYDGQTWSANKAQTLLRFNLEFEPLSEPIDYTVTLQPHNRHWLFALDLPATLPDNSRLTSEFQLISRQPVKEVLRYEMRSFTRYRLDNRADLNLQAYLQLPARAAPRGRELISGLRAEAGNDAELVQRMLDYFRNEPFYYTRQPPLLFDDPVDEFLFETRRGFCEHYASAFVVLMRAAGVPSRVVTGYQGGEMNPLADYMIVRQSDAHAWAEVWLDGQGWVRVDPTSVIPPSRIELTADLLQRQPETRERIILDQAWLLRSLRQAGFMLDAVNNRWNQWVIGYNTARQNAFLAALGLPEITWRGLSTILFSSLALAVALIAWLVFKPLQIRLDPATRLYRRFLRKLGKAGFDKAAYETPHDFARRVAQARQDLAPAVNYITHQYLQLRYAPRRDQATRLDKLRHAVRQLRLR